MGTLVDNLRRYRDHPDLGGWLEEAAVVIEKLSLENDTFRSALQKILELADSDNGLTAWDGSEIARAALTPESLDRFLQDNPPPHDD